jgi:hypothetical protein
VKNRRDVHYARQLCATDNRLLTVVVVVVVAAAAAAAAMKVAHNNDDNKLSLAAIQCIQLIVRSSCTEL